MSDELMEGDAAPVSDTQETSVPQEVIDKIESVFSQADESDHAEAQTTEGGLSGDQAARANPRASQRHREQTEELVEDGLVRDGNEEQADIEEETTDQAAEEEGESEEAAQPAEAKQDNDLPALDPLVRFATNELGWSDERIDAALKADPESATKTFETLAQTYANLSRQFLLNPGTQPATGSQQVPQTPAQQASPTSKLDKVYQNLQAFAEVNGEELTEFAKALKEELIDPFKQMMAEAQVRQQEALKSEALGTMGELSKQFADVYGTDDKALTPAQSMARNTLGMWADQFRTAARLQGRNMSVSAAMKQAHLVLTANQREAIVRRELTKQVQKRSKAITAKPTQRANPAVARKSTAAAEEAAARKMAEIGMD